MEYRDYLQRLAAQEPVLAGELAGFTGLEQMLGWMQRRGLELAALDLIAQDEYSHDLLVPLEGRWLVFGLT